MKTILNVRGMTCGHCVKHVADALRGTPGVAQASVIVGRAEIEHDSSTSVDSLIEAVKAEGYEASAAT